VIAITYASMTIQNDKNSINYRVSICLNESFMSKKLNLLVNEPN